MGILTCLSPRPSVSLSVSLSVQWVNCGRMADWIWVPFGLVSGLGRGMGVLDGVHIWKREREFLGIALPVDLNGIFECIFKT